MLQGMRPEAYGEVHHKQNEDPGVLHIPTIIDNNGVNVNGSQKKDVMETNDAPSSSATYSMPVSQKNSTEVKK
ncbi:Protein of unknown function [Gryllus bimaculatus]|nr:Protein of unknown function [Gryllus bimaculatus]